MQQLPNYGDERQTAFCCYCGGPTETRDHVPSRVLLDVPYPENLPVVPACQDCNNGFSLDEEYLACLIDCVLAGSASPDAVTRRKVQRLLREKPSLSAKLSSARHQAESLTQYAIEHARVENIILKLARGHALYELCEPQLYQPSSLTFLPIQSLNDEQRTSFERPPFLPILPEVGSRAMQRLVLQGSAAWIVVQPGRYRYLTLAAHLISVRIVLSEYLACEVIWQH